MRAVRKKKAKVQIQVPKVWLKAEFEFPSTFSYRQPDASAQFAIGSPIPSPAAVKLAMVDTAIRWSGDVNCGRQVFDWLKTCEVQPVPPEQVVRFRVFLKRLKPAKEGGGLTESVGIRDYFLMCGSLKIFLQVPQDKFEKAKDLLRKVRKLGTSDSVCWCCEVSEISESDLPKKFFPLKLVSLPENLLRQMLVQGFIVVRLSDLTPKSEFDGFNPFGGA
ncbi:MAG: hypothetical protein N3B10_15490, partial [Armatimonadetes bacterium]|nr:hypothetical protein [Armatimonadota bacterium]